MFKTHFGNKSWFRTLTLTCASIFIYVFMEWVFFVTKPSFMSSMDLMQKGTVFFLSSFILVIPALALVGLAVILARILKIFTWIAFAIPALVFTVLSLILLDNFTYTVFKVGIVTSQGVWRGVYALGLLIIFIAFLKNISLHLRRDLGDQANLIRYFVAVVFFISTMVFVSKAPQLHLNPSGNDFSFTDSSTLPNIILLGVDGINATHMSVYGYERDTTPNLTKLASNALVAENAFSNAGKTGGSLTSILTGKPSTETRVFFPPDILLGEDAYQHLPGILKQLGYSTIQVTMQYYGDAYERNIQDGFDTVNFRSENTNPLLGRFARMGGGGGFYFAGEMILRITERLEHVFFIKSMENPYVAVTQPAYALHDNRRLEAMIHYLSEADGPLFLHVHMMDTHGPIFYVPNQVFSTGQTQDKEWTTDFYDDAILNSDKYISELFDYLSKSGKIQNTIIILYSDHGIQWDTLERVPLMFWFPGGQYTGAIKENVQLIDIAPTILDYLEVAQPAWMEGQSILTDNLSPTRQIFSANVGQELMVTEDRTTWIVDESKIFPPFYDLGKVNLIVCDRWFSLDLRSPSLTYGDVEGSTAVCVSADIPSPHDAKDLLLRQLLDKNYDIKNFPAAISLQAVQ